jgi:hypothetical protein
MKVGSILIAVLTALLAVGGAANQEKSVREKEQERMALNQKFDHLKIRQKKTFTVEQRAEFLRTPLSESPVGEFSVARVPPRVKLMILPDLDPEYFLDVKDPGDAYMFAWANWAYVSRSQDNHFYFAASNHRGYGCQINIYEYVPARELVHRLVDVTKILGWTKDNYSDGKIHGHMGIMPDGTLWACTHFGPHPDDSWFANGYRGSWMLSYNIYTRETRNWGIPIVGGNLATFHLDTQRGRLVGTGSLSNMVLCYDVLNKQVRFAGYPPKGWTWGPRTMLLDQETGKFWTVDMNDGYAFFSFDPEFNKFEHYDVRPPVNPMTQKTGFPRGHTDRPAIDGWYYWATIDGTLFRFRPEGAKGPEVQLVGTTWDTGRDVLQMALDPGRRYIYYYPKENSPIVQYDVSTGKRKIIGWLQDFFFEKYGYCMGEVYGMEISSDGDYLVIVTNGTFEGRGTYFGHPALLVVEIPAEER